MTNLNQLNLQELSSDEMKNVNGGLVIVLSIALGMAFMAGVGVGVALYAATKD